MLPKYNGELSYDMSQIFVIVDIQLGIEIHFLILKVYIQMVYLSESKKASGIIDKGGFLCVIVKSENWLLFWQNLITIIIIFSFIDQMSSTICNSAASCFQSLKIYYNGSFWLTHYLFCLVITVILVRGRESIVVVCQV